MDYDDGEIRYKTSIDLTDEQYGPNLFRQLISANVTIMDRYLAGILAVLYSSREPEEMIAGLESQ